MHLSDLSIALAALSVLEQAAQGVPVGGNIAGAIQQAAESTARIPPHSMSGLPGFDTSVYAATRDVVPRARPVQSDEVVESPLKWFKVTETRGGASSTDRLLILANVALGDARASSDRPVPRPATKDTPQRDTLTRANTVEESRLSPEIIQAKHRLSVLNEQKAHHLGSTYKVLWEDLEMDWEMVAISGGPAKLMSHDSWLKLTAGPLPKQELALIKAEVDSTFEAFLRSKYGESHVVMFRDPFERPRLMKNLRDDIKTLHKGTGRDGSVFKTLFILKKKLEALGLVKDRVLKVTRVRAFAKIPEDMLKAIEFGVYSKSDIEFWKEHTQLHVKVLLEEDGLGMHGAEAQRRVRKHLRDA